LKQASPVMPTTTGAATSLRTQ